ncbi:metallophosphoesterase family protein [Paenibacillus sp. 1P07SE]|uniref:metallophosphoesterase family protein n=1 Tax=Paenibacillus sp. 1P07SE TaxID=3132209 RepID=UPI0039A74B15
METVQFIHLTDTHMNAPGRELFQVGMADKVKRVFQDVRRSGYAPAFAVITGDLTHEGNAEDYAYFRQLVDEGSALIDAPVYVMLGNHDHRSPFREGYLGETPSEQPYYYTATVGGLRLIALNSQVPGDDTGAGAIDQEQLAWLAEQLQTTAPNGTVIALHHPMLAVNDVAPEYLLTNTEEVAAVIKGGCDIVGVFAGHVHTHNTGFYNGIFSVAATGTTYMGKRMGDGFVAGQNYCSYNIVTVTNRRPSVQTVTLPVPHEELFRLELAQFGIVQARS